MAIDSTESATSSLELREYFMPSWPMMIPSQIPMVENSKGVPPAMRIPAFTASETWFKWRCPGMSSFAELAIPIMGRIDLCICQSQGLKKRAVGCPFQAFFHLIRAHE